MLGQRSSRQSLRIAAIAVLAISVPVTVGLGQDAFAATAPSTAAHSTSQPEPPALTDGWVNEGTTKTFSIDVAQKVHWQLAFYVSYPETTGRIKSSVDGRPLPEVHTAVLPGVFGVFAYSACFTLTPGKHTISVTAVKLPSPQIPLQVQLWDPAWQHP